MAFVIYSGSKRLSGFYPNDIPGVFKFRKNDWKIFSSRAEAESFIDRVNAEVNNPENIERYGEHYAKKHQSIARNLKIYEEKSFNIFWG